MGNKPSRIASKAADEDEIADFRASPSIGSIMNAIITRIARLNPTNHSTIGHHGDAAEPNYSTPDYPTDNTQYPLISCSTRFDSLSETSSCITDYMDGLPLALVKDVVPEAAVKPDVDEVKALFSKLESQDKIGIMQEFLKSCDDHQWFDTLASAEVRDLRFDILGNLPAELVQGVTDYLDPEDIVRSVAVSKKWGAILSNPEFCGSQLASHFEVKAAEMTENVSTSEKFYTLTRRYHGQKMGRPLTRVEFPMPVSVEGSRLDFHRCLFDYCCGRLAFLEYSGQMLRALHLIFVSTMFSIVVHDFSSDSFELINDLKMSGRMIAMLSVFGYCLVKDLGTPTTRSRLHKFELPSSDYEGLTVVGDKVAVLFKDMVCVWSVRSTTLRKFKVNAGFKSLDSTVWAMLHPIHDAFLVAKWEWCRDRRGSYLGDLITTTYSCGKGKILSTVRTPMNIPSYRLGHMSEFFFQTCYKDSVRHISLFGIINNKDSTLAQGLAHYLVEHNFQKKKVFVKTLNTQGFQNLTGKCPSDFIASYIPGGTLSLIHHIEPFSHHNYDVNEENFRQAVHIPTYHFSDNSGQLGSEDDILRLRHAFADDKWHVILCERAIQVWCYHEGIHMAMRDQAYHSEMVVRWFNRSANRKQQRQVLAFVERLRRPRQFLLDA